MDSSNTNSSHTAAPRCTQSASVSDSLVSAVSASVSAVAANVAAVAANVAAVSATVSAVAANASAVTASVSASVSATVIDYTIGLLSSPQPPICAAPRVRFQAELDEMRVERLQTQCLFGPKLEPDFETIDTKGSQQKRTTDNSKQLVLKKRLHNEDPLNLDGVEDRPMCPSCYASLNADLNYGCKMMARDCRQRSAWLAAEERKMRQTSQTSSAEQIRQQCDALEAEAADIAAQLDELRAQQTAADAQIRAIQRTKIALHDQWIRLEHSNMARQCLTMEAKLANREDDPFHQVFRIGVSWGRTASINGMTMDVVQADLSDAWPQVNSGFGQIALMVAAIGRRIRYETRDYTMLPNASSSEVRENVRVRGDSVPEQWRRFPLYCTGFGSDARPFDRALIGLHTCVRELEAELRRRSAAKRPADGFELPHPTERLGFRKGGSRLNYAIITTGHTLSSWNEMIRLLLINLAYLRDYVCETEPVGEEEVDEGDFYDAES